jgi:hypothetical protein
MGAAMEGFANAGMVDMEAVTGSANFDMEILIQEILLQ